MYLAIDETSAESSRYVDGGSQCERYANWNTKPYECSNGNAIVGDDAVGRDKMIGRAS